MIESYLHQIWKTKRLPQFSFELENKNKVDVLDFGEYNENNSGPDFKFGAIKLDDIRFHGHIEMHVRSSDWYRHKHHVDVNYNNVILHVVYVNDKQVIQNGVAIPTIAIKDLIDEEHYKKFIRKQLSLSEFPCEHQIKEIDEFHFNYMKIRSVTDKLNEKTSILHRIDIQSKAGAFYHFMGLAFGTSINKMPFNSLLQRVPYTSVKDVPKVNRFNLVLCESGIIQEKGMNDSHRKREWQYKGTRPKNSPDLRVRQFALLVQEFDFESTIELLSTDKIKESFRTLIEKSWQGNLTVSKLSKTFVNHLIINAVVPFLWFCGELDNNTFYQEKAMDLLSLLPAEKNNVIRKWNKINVFAKTAFDSQGLLSMHRYHCCRKKCLSCSVGKKVLNRE
ncbi:MAG TPA: DUF2851 family protein [Crocinitomicaceae bacterium]|nr:DUF2851 family protein [Crocinitomicaceae bacterium]